MATQHIAFKLLDTCMSGRLYVRVLRRVIDRIGVLLQGQGDDGTVGEALGS